MSPTNKTAGASGAGGTSWATRVRLRAGHPAPPERHPLHVQADLIRAEDEDFELNHDRAMAELEADADRAGITLTEAERIVAARARR